MNIKKLTILVRKFYSNSFDGPWVIILRRPKLLKYKFVTKIAHAKLHEVLFIKFQRVVEINVTMLLLWVATDKYIYLHFSSEQMLTSVVIYTVYNADGTITSLWLVSDLYWAHWAICLLCFFSSSFFRVSEISSSLGRCLHWLYNYIHTIINYYPTKQALFLINDVYWW